MARSPLAWVALCASAVAALLFPLPASAAPIPTILDTDIGTDADDLFALMLVLSRPDVYDLRLVQASTFNTTTRARLVARILHSLGRFDVPVAVGRYTGEQDVPEAAILGNYSLANFTAAGGVVSYGTGALRALMAAATPAAPLLIIEIAPATSLGDVLRPEPGLAAGCLVVAMSGCVRRGYMNASTCTAEYNVATDVPASQAVYGAAWAAPLVTAPLDTTVLMQWRGPLYRTLVAANATGRDAAATTLLAHYAAWYANGGSSSGAMLPFSPSTGTSTMYDPLAAYMAGAYAGAWAAARDGEGLRGAAGAPPPAFPNVVVEALQLAVDAGGNTVVTPGARTVYAATSFSQVGRGSVDAIGGDFFGSVLA